MRKLLASLTIVTAIIVIVVSNSFAQSPRGGINFTVSPAFVSLITDPGKEVSTSVRIRNNSNTTESLEVRLATFETGQEGAPVLRDPGKEDEFVSWVKFSDSEFTLSPNESKNVKVTISPTRDAALGYYYAIVFDRKDKTQADGSSAVIQAAPAIPLLLEVKSNQAKRELQLVDFKTDKLIYEYLPTNFIVTIKNTGNIHAVPVGNVFVDSSFREDVAVLPVNSGFGNILPQGTRDYEASWKEGFAVVENNKTQYDFSKADKFRIGKYKANILMIYDNGERDIPMEASVSFWVIPWKIILGGLIIVAFVSIGVKSSIMTTLKKVRK